MKKLKDPETSTEKFFSASEHLKTKLGPYLFQLPPRWRPDIERLSQFLEVLPGKHRHVLEFRDSRWLIPEVFQLMREHNVALCIHDFADLKIPNEITADFTYVRFHGPTAVKYAGSYSDRQLEKWAQRMREWSSELRALYAYFNNDPGGAAVKNALTLKRFLEVK